MQDTSERIAHYRLVRKLGQGGMGEVYRAVDEKLGRNVALKLLPETRADEAASQARLVREAQAASHLNHPGIVTVHDVGVWRNRVYLVMELVEGKRFVDLIRTGVTPKEAVALVAQAAQALTVAHKRGILHRDIKPDNLMVSDEGRVKILDFGLAKLRGGAELDVTKSLEQRPSQESLDALMPTEMMASTPSEPTPPVSISGLRTMVTEAPQRSSPWPKSMGPSIDLTAADSLLGTPAYMSPEHATRQPLDARSEIYSLGLVLYELCTRTRPLARDSLDETLAAAAAADIPPLDKQPGLPRPVARVLRRALARAPSDRYADMATFADALARAERALGARRRIVMWAAGLVVVGAGTATALIATRGRDATPSFAVTGSTVLTRGTGCDEFPVFTPDGKEIIYDGLADGDDEILAITVDGKTRRRLTRSPGWDLGAAVSPDGRHVAYVHFGEQGREVRVVGIAGDEAAPPRTIGASRGFPSWTAEGALIYADEAGVIWRTTLDGTPAELARLPTDHFAVHVQQFPDGELVIAMRPTSQSTSLVTLARAKPGGVAQPIVPEWKVGDWGHVRLDRARTGIYYVAPSASSSTAKLHWRSRDGSTTRVLEEMFMPNSYSIANRGDQLVYSACTTNRLVGRITKGTFEPIPRIGEQWSPFEFSLLTGTELVLSSMNSGSVPALWRVKLDGSAESLLDTGATSHATSRDGRWIAWTALEPAEVGIHIREVAGGAIRRLTDNASDENVEFSRDGKQLYFTRSDADANRVYAVPVAGDAPAVQVSPAGVRGFASAPDRDELALIVNAQDIVIGPPGGPFKPVNGAPARPYALIAYSADGKRLILAPSASELFELDLATGATRPLWTSQNEVLSQIEVPADGSDVWALISSDRGNLYLAAGSFR